MQDSGSKGDKPKILGSQYVTYKQEETPVCSWVGFVDRVKGSECVLMVQASFEVEGKVVVAWSLFGEFECSGKL